MIAVLIWAYHAWSAIPTIVKRLGAAFAVFFILWTAVLGYGAVREHRGFTSGAAYAADSAREATILRLSAQHLTDSAKADSAVSSARQLSAPLDTAATRLSATPRHSPRIEAVSLPAGMDTSMVGVFVESTGEHFILPRNAAQYWHVSDSLVTVASALLAKYAAANKQWQSAWTDEHQARIGSDSLAAVWRARALAGIPATVSSTWKRKVAFAAVVFTLGMVAHNNVHLRIR